MGVAIIVIALGIVVLMLAFGGGKGKPRGAQITDVSAKFRVKPGWLRVAAVCGTNPIVARVAVAGADKGSTPVEVPLPGGPPGDHVLDLHLEGRIGGPTDARFQYSLPSDPTNGTAIEVQLEGCAPQQFGK
jgi:hypothetical protein